MWDNNENEREQQRNLIIAVVLSAALLMVWMHWFAPTPQPEPPQQAEPAQTQPVSPDTTGLLATGPEDSPPATGDRSLALPPIPEQSDPAADEITLSDGSLALTFTRIGARLKQAAVLLGEKGQNTIDLVPLEEAKRDTEALYPLGLRFSDPRILDGIDLRRFDVVDQSETSITFALKLGSQALVQKTFRLSDRPNVVEVEVAYTNLTDTFVSLGGDIEPAFCLNWAPAVASNDDQKGIKPTFIQHQPEGNLTETVAKMSFPREGKTLEPVDWVAVRSAYFVIAIRPAFENARAWAAGDVKGALKAGGTPNYRFGVAVPRFEVGSQKTETRAFQVYIGPNQQATLATAWDSLEDAWRFFESPKWAWMDWFSKKLLGLMNWFYASVYANYGFAIIFVTLVVRLCMLPLTLKSMRSMKRMQQLAPEIEALKEKYGDNQQEMSRKMTELYRERGVNPVAGCFPLLLQMPVFIAFYRMIWNAYELRGAPFILWITDLSEPDQLLHMPWMPFQQFQYLNLIPILMAGAMLLNQKMMPTSGPTQNPQQKVMMTIMPVFFAFICYNMASGTSLYILTSTLLGIVQQKFTRAATDEEVKKKKAVGKGQHFYTAAKSRQRQKQRETRRQKKQ